MADSQDPRKIDEDDVAAVIVVVLEATAATEKRRACNDRQIAAHNANLHPEQAAIGYGGHWVGFADDDFVIFGEVPPLTEVITGKDLESEEKFDRDIQRHNLPSFSYSRNHPEGLPVRIPAGRVWPIHPDIYEAAKRCGWNWDAFDDGLKTYLAIARTAYRAHQQVTA